MQKFFVYGYIYLFLNLELTGKISLELDSTQLLLGFGRKLIEFPNYNNFRS